MLHHYYVRLVFSAIVSLLFLYGFLKITQKNSVTNINPKMLIGIHICYTVRFTYMYKSSLGIVLSMGFPI